MGAASRTSLFWRCRGEIMDGGAVDAVETRNVGGAGPGSTVRSVLSQDPRPTSFENHPGLRGREPEARDLADALRRLIRLSVSTAPPPAETARLTAQLTALADRLESHLPAEPLPRFIAPDEDGPANEIPLGSAMPYDVVVGPFNPIALPVELDFDPPKAFGRAVFDVAYEGAPGCVHGAVLAAVFDIILTAANAIEGATGPTVRLALRYVRPTLTNEQAVFEGWVTEVTDRRILSKGRIVQDGIVTVEADGEFAIFNRDRVQGMARSRRAFSAAGRKKARAGEVETESEPVAAKAPREDATGGAVPAGE
jgi:Thioesterase superfamily